MIEARVAGSDLEVELTGFHSFMLAWRPHWTYTTPLEHVVKAEARPPLGVGTKRYINGPGSDRKHYAGRLICAKRRAPILKVELDTYPYHEMILSVPDPASTATEIQNALPAQRR
jgi:hypothetical protein